MPALLRLGAVHRVHKKQDDIDSCQGDQVRNLAVGLVGGNHEDVTLNL